MTKSQIERLWISEGGDPKAAGTAAAVALAESGGRPTAVNDKNSDGSIDRGLFQINSVHGAQSTLDLRKNVRAAIAISSNGKNWHPWVTYNTGAYRKYASGGGSVSPSVPSASGTATQSPAYRTIPGKSLLPERQAAAASFLGQRGSSANQNLAFAQQIAGLQDQPATRQRVAVPSSPEGSRTGDQNLPSTSSFAKSHSPLLEEIFNGPGSNDFAVKNGQKVSPDIYAAVWDQHTNHVHVAAGPKTVVELGNLAQRMGLHVGENPHFGGVTQGAHVANSYHYKGEAIDVSGSTKQMESFAKEVAKLYRL